MSSAAFDAPAMEAPATLPASLIAGAVLLRPTLTPTSQPVAVVVLLEIDAKGVS